MKFAIWNDEVVPLITREDAYVFSPQHYFVVKYEDKWFDAQFLVKKKIS